MAILDIFQVDSTSRSVTLRIIDSTDGTPETGVVFDTSGIDLWYRREDAAVVSITEADLTTPLLTDTWETGGFLHISDGEYRLDVPNAAFATGVNHVDIGGTVTGMVVIGGRVKLVAYDPEDAVRLGLTALPNAVPGAAGGVFIAGTNAATTVTTSFTTTFTGSLTGSVASVTGAVGSVTGAVGSVTGAVGSVAGNVDGNVSGTVASVVTKTGYALVSTGADLILKTSTFALAIADACWDEVLTGATHAVAASAGKRLRQLEAAFVVDSGTAQAGAAGTITLAATASATDNIYRGDRIIITEGTGAGEHGIVTSYVGSTQVATMAESWVITPDATSVYEVQPASVDIETWQHNVVTGDGDWAALKVETAAIVADTNELQTDWVDGGRLDSIIDAILVDTGTTIPATLTTIDDFLDTEIAAILAAVDTEVAAILVDTGTTLPSQITAVFTDAMTESYRSTGATGSPAQVLYEILSGIGEFAISGTTKTSKKLDGSTTAKTYTLDDGTSPTSITEAT